MEFFDDIELKNETVDTNYWRPFKAQKMKGNRTILFFGIDEKSAKDLKAIGFKPYFAMEKIRISVDDDKRKI